MWTCICRKGDFIPLRVIDRWRHGIFTGLMSAESMMGGIIVGYSIVNEDITRKQLAIFDAFHLCSDWADSVF